MVYGYVRVSTQGQVDRGNSIEAQTEELRRAGAAQLFVDAGISGATTPKERPEMIKLLGTVQEGDTVVVTRLDRLSRSAVGGYELVENLLKKGVSVRVLNMGLIEDSTAGRLILHIMLAFSEFERETIKERMLEGKAIARQDPEWRDGRPKKFTRAQVEHAIDLLKDHTYAQVQEMTGMSKSTLIRAARAAKESSKAAGELNFRDKAWYDSIVEGAEQISIEDIMKGETTDG